MEQDERDELLRRSIEMQGEAMELQKLQFAQSVEQLEGLHAKMREMIAQQLRQETPEDFKDRVAKEQAREDSRWADKLIMDSNHMSAEAQRTAAMREQAAATAVAGLAQARAWEPRSSGTQSDAMRELGTEECRRLCKVIAG